MKKRLTPADHMHCCEVLDTDICKCYDDFEEENKKWFVSGVIWV